MNDEGFIPHVRRAVIQRTVQYSAMPISVEDSRFLDKSSTGETVNTVVNEAIREMRSSDGMSDSSQT